MGPFTEPCGKDQSQCQESIGVFDFREFLAKVQLDFGTKLTRFKKMDLPKKLREKFLPLPLSDIFSESSLCYDRIIKINII